MDNFNLRKYLQKNPLFESKYGGYEKYGDELVIFYKTGWLGSKDPVTIYKKSDINLDEYIHFKRSIKEMDKGKTNLLKEILPQILEVQKGTALDKVKDVMIKTGDKFQPSVEYVHGGGWEDSHGGFEIFPKQYEFYEVEKTDIYGKKFNATGFKYNVEFDPWMPMGKNSYDIFNNKWNSIMKTAAKIVDKEHTSEDPLDSALTLQNMDPTEVEVILETIPVNIIPFIGVHAKVLSRAYPSLNNDFEELVDVNFSHKPSLKKVMNDVGIDFINWMKEVNFVDEDLWS